MDDPKQGGELDRGRVETAQLMSDMAIKAFLALVGAGVYVTFAVALLRNPNWPIAAVEGILTMTVGQMYGHYFPWRSRSKK